MKTFSIISFHTIRELLIERILYNVFFVAIFLLCLSYLAALLVSGHRDRIMLDFGTATIALSVFAVCAGAASRLVRNEIENRSIFLTLVRPVGRPTYYFAKWFGIVSFTFINLALLTIVLAVGLWQTGGQMTLGVFQAISLIGVESLVITALALLISQFLRSGLTTLLTFTYIFTSHNHEQFSYLNSHAESKSPLFSLFSSITPDGSVFLMDTRPYYELPLTLAEWAQRTSYGVLWALFFLLMGNAVFYRRNL